MTLQWEARHTAKSHGACLFFLPRPNIANGTACCLQQARRWEGTLEWASTIDLLFYIDPYLQENPDLGTV